MEDYKTTQYHKDIELKLYQQNMVDEFLDIFITSIRKFFGIAII